jgi:imidazoleglycerol-phosphate dehydratase
MSEKTLSFSRSTKETKIELTLSPEPGLPGLIETGVPFLGHVLTSMAFHGGFGLSVRAEGDLHVDPHHLVEDLGLVLGDAFHRLFEVRGTVARFGHAVVPMDDALSEAAVDVCERSFLVYRADYPQTVVGTFQVDLLKEFFQAFTNRARINLHVICRYGDNSHHMAEALFKAFGRALARAYAPKAGNREEMSTKGAL